MSQPKLFYVYDPMCAWCWGYKPTWEKVKATLPAEVEVQCLLGGLAPDSDEAMPMEMRAAIESYWERISGLLGTEFNHDFWRNNTPRRSTYPACRACLLARDEGKELEMIQAIQHAYYRDAKNPSDTEVLVETADLIGLDVGAFAEQLHSDETRLRLRGEIEMARTIGGNSFPSLFLQVGTTITELPIEYADADKTVAQIKGLLNNTVIT
ncbi:DsbA family protein [Vibrio ishigakensis]|uniref:DsbA family protein n=1 Tax=Vibrio ishigakensis TaxID=1481914 RepID=UPI0021C2631E|nr:DsbA family protein [Vibrio ishigakensis]